jgi:glycine/D-amino acid oxidase-like deaminating enzyme
MRELMAHSVSVWERDPEAYSYHPVGYMQISPEVMHTQVGTIYEQQKAIGYDRYSSRAKPSRCATCRASCTTGRPRNITSVLHEKRGGYANNMASMRGLAGKAAALGVEIVAGVAVTGFQSATAPRRYRGRDVRGNDRLRRVVVGVGPWINPSGTCSRCPGRSASRARRQGHDGVRMWHYMALQEGTLGVDPDYQKTNDGRMPPVIHVDTDAPLTPTATAVCSPTSCGASTTSPISTSAACRAARCRGGRARPDDVRVDPYGPKSPEFVVDDNFADMWTSALAFCQKRFEGQHAKYRNEPSGGIGCFTPDSFPVFDRFRENVYVIADSNHGYKMIGVGELVADELWARSARCSSRSASRATPRVVCTRSATVRSLELNSRWSFSRRSRCSVR